MRPVWIVFVFLSILCTTQACSRPSTPEAEDTATSSSDTLQPEQQIDPTKEQRGQVSCSGIVPPENIQQFQHDQCADWGIDECTSTLDYCTGNDQTSLCCCILCGMRGGEPACFNVRCP